MEKIVVIIIMIVSFYKNVYVVHLEVLIQKLPSVNTPTLAILELVSSILYKIFVK